jgi:hypothetical protein
MRFNADHLGAQIAEQRGAKRARDITPKIEDASAFEHLSHAFPPEVKDHSGE